MNKTTVLSELKKMGTAQNIKIYKRHGAKDPMFGVSFKNLGVLKKKYKNQTKLARDLWKSGNMDARTLACMIADPEEMKADEFDKWVKDVDYTLLASELAGLASRSGVGKTRIKKWIKSKDEFVSHCGYSTVSSTLKLDPDLLDDNFCLDVLERIEKTIHKVSNNTKSSMNWCLIALGSYKPKLTSKVKTSAKKIGKVEIDHGETSCKTPDAITYIEKTLAHQKKKKKK